jgi:DNA-binding transcriptional LysR family regulator
MQGPWVLNPLGCLVREALRARLEGAGIALRVAAEAYNLELQLALVGAGVGLGLLPDSYLKQLPARRRPSNIRRWEFNVSIALARATHIGRLGIAADFFEAGLRNAAH